MLMRWSRYVMAVFLAMIVMPFSRSRSIESMIRSATAWFSRKRPDCQSMASTSVVLPWSTWAMIAMLRIDSPCSIRSILPDSRDRPLLHVAASPWRGYHDRDAPGRHADRASSSGNRRRVVLRRADPDGRRRAPALGGALQPPLVGRGLRERRRARR